MPVRRFHVPAPSGDFELIALDDKQCKLVTENLVASEVEQIKAFLRVCRDPSRKWVDDLVGVSATGRSEIVIEAPIQQAGAALAGAAAPDRGRLTAVRSVNGSMVAVIDSSDPQEIPRIAAETAKPEAVAAVTVNRPTRCCPTPVEGPMVRSSRVLKTFCTAKQWADWQEKGWVIAIGHRSGHAYRICHRHHPAARAQRKIVWDLTEGKVIHCWNWSVPPAEEVLAAMLFVQNREEQIRNRSTALGCRSFVFDDPTGHGGSDGIWDAAQFRGMGAAVASLGRAMLGDLSPLLGRSGLLPAATYALQSGDVVNGAYGDGEGNMTAAEYDAAWQSVSGGILDDDLPVFKSWSDGRDELDVELGL
jgi:hypothetical protein